MAEAAVQYSIAKEKARDKYDETRLRMAGYQISNIVDTSTTGMITSFENEYPLQKVSLDDYERRIKKLADSEAGDYVSLKQLIECFKDNQFLNQIEKEDSVVRALLTDPSLSKDKNGVYFIPYLMLIGILYCASNPNVRAQKFFELCQMELDPQISAGDKELKDYCKKLLDISYRLSIKVYNQFHPEQPKKEWIEVNDWQTLYDDIFENDDDGFLEKIFGSQSKLETEIFLKKLSKE